MDDSERNMHIHCTDASIALLRGLVELTPGIPHLLNSTVCFLSANLRCHNAPKKSTRQFYSHGKV